MRIGKGLGFTLDPLTERILNASPLFTREEEQLHFKHIDKLEKELKRLTEEHQTALALTSGENADGLKKEYTRQSRRLEGEIERSKQQAILSNVRLVLSIAKQYAYRAPLEDNFQEGILGLYKALEKFDYRRGYKLSTYSSWWIRQQIVRSIMMNEFRHGMRFPVYITEAVNKVNKIIKELRRHLPHEPKDSEIVGEIVRMLDTSREGAEKLLVKYYVYTATELSIDQPLSNASDILVGEMISDGDAPNPELEVDKTRMLARARGTYRLIERALARRERWLLIISLRAGFREEPITLEEAGARPDVDLTRERVRQIEHKCYRFLRDDYGLTKDQITAAAAVLRSNGGPPPPRPRQPR